MASKASEKAVLDRQIKRATQLSNIRCRIGGDGHHWVECIPDFDPPTKSTRAVAKQCQNCRAVKRSVITRSGEVIQGPSTQYPRNYLAHRTDDMEPDERLICARAVRAATFNDSPPTHHLMPVIEEGEQA